jgi:hypothetical protein
MLELTDEGREQLDRVIKTGQEGQLRMFQRVDDRGLQVIAEAFDLILAAAKEVQAEEG